MINVSNPYRYRYFNNKSRQWSIPSFLSIGTYVESPYGANWNRTITTQSSGDLLNSFVLIDCPPDATITNVRTRSFSRLGSTDAVSNVYTALLDGLDTDGIAYNNVIGSYSRSYSSGSYRYSGSYTARNIVWTNGFIPVFIKFNGALHTNGVEYTSDLTDMTSWVVDESYPTTHPNWKVSFFVKNNTGSSMLFNPRYHNDGTWYSKERYCTIFLQPGTYEISKIYDVLKSSSRDCSWQTYERSLNTKTLTVEQTTGAYYLDFVNTDEEVFDRNWTYKD